MLDRAMSLLMRDHASAMRLLQQRQEDLDKRRASYRAAEKARDEVQTTVTEIEAEIDALRKVKG